MGYATYDAQLLSAHDQWRLAQEAAEKARNKALDSGTLIPKSNKNWLNAVLGTLVGGAALLGTRGKAKGLLASTSRLGRATGRVLPWASGIGAGATAGGLSEFFQARHNQKINELWHQYELKKDVAESAFANLDKWRNGSKKPIGQDILDFFNPGHVGKLEALSDAYHQQLRDIGKLRENAAKSAIGTVGRVGIDVGSGAAGLALGALLTRGRGAKGLARLTKPLVVGGTTAATTGLGELGRAWYNARRRTEANAAIEDAQDVAYQLHGLLNYEKNKTPWQRILTGLGLSD